MVKILPFQPSRFVNGAKKDGGDVDGDLPKVFRSGGLERCIDPPDDRLAESELYILEHRGLGEVK